MDLLHEVLCSTMTLFYATNPYTIQVIPKGDCEYCCPINDGDMKLFMNIYEYGTEFEFDWLNGSDWRLLLNNRTNVFYVHGFTEQSTGPAATEMRQAYMSRGQENLIVVDWSTLAAGPWYHSAVANTKKVATWLAGVIDSLVIRGLPLESIHLVGFSLGAEIVGLTAKQLTVGKLRRVTGLDPALPLFHPHLASGRLDQKDAEFVDVIHTDGGVFGFDIQIGHADFFPNGGRPAQPGCRIETVVHTGRLKEFVACSHNRAWKFFAESVRYPDAFPAYECHSYQLFEAGKCPSEGEQAYMGYKADPSLRGKFFLDTRTTAPYGKGQHEGLSEQDIPPEVFEDKKPGEEEQHLHHTFPLITLLESKGPIYPQGLPKEAEEGSPVNRDGRQTFPVELYNFSGINYDDEMDHVSALYRYFYPSLMGGDDFNPFADFSMMTEDYNQNTNNNPMMWLMQSMPTIAATLADNSGFWQSPGTVEDSYNTGNFEKNNYIEQSPP